MKDLPLKKLRNFGGKLGAELAEMQCTTAGQVAALPHKALIARFGEERATFIARAVRGYSDEPVQVSTASVLCCLGSLLAGLMRVCISHASQPNRLPILRVLAWSFWTSH